MSRFSLLGCTSLLLLTLALPLSAQNPGKPKELEWSHAFDLAVRKFGEADFTKDTRKIGVEVFKDDNNDLGLYLSEKGDLAVCEGFQNVKLPLAKNPGPDWLTGLDLPARKAGQKEFVKDTKVYSMEVFRDPNLNTWLYATETGELAVAGARTKATGGARAPKWVHSFDVTCRKGGVKDWKDALKYGVEVYRDDNTGNLVYICGETGSIAAVPVGSEIKGEGKAPEWLHGLDLGCRKPMERSFSKETGKIGVEVYRDETTGNLVYISEAGSIAVARAPQNVKAPTPDVKEPQWTHGLNVKCRAYGEKEFSDKTRVFGVEVFRDPNASTIIYVDDLGKISAVAAAKQ